jgi:signal transduction histidine kinase
MALVFALARKLEDVLVRPIRALGGTARRISETRNYALRATKHDEDEIGELTDQFNAMLAEIEKQNTQISAARGEAERLSQLKDEFLATLSHELRTPLTPILGWVQILKRSGAGNAQVQQAAEVIERNVRTQTQIVNDLLDMSRIISGKVPARSSRRPTWTR